MKTEELLHTALFQGLSTEEIESALRALSGMERRYRKEEILLHAGTAAPRMGLVLAGSVTIESNDLWGNRTLLSHAESGQCFAESYALLPGEPMPVDVVANADCHVLFLNLGGLHAAHAPWARQLTENLLRISARKNQALSARSFHTAPKGVRGRIMAYLNTCSLQARSTAFDIPFDRQQLADYLGLDRTALSKELGRMGREGLIAFRKNHFEILKNAETA